MSSPASLKTESPATEEPRYLILDCESVPDGRLIRFVKYADDSITDEEAVLRAQEEARERSNNGSDFIPVSFQVPVAICVLRVGADFRPQRLTCLDAPEFRPSEITRIFWKNVIHHAKATLVTFNGRGFDLPLLELAAFRYGCNAALHFSKNRHRYQGSYLDLMDWLTNFGAYRLVGGLNLLSKILGKPGKMETTGDQVYQLWLNGKKQEINDYCMFDTLDTYFIFLRSRVLSGELSLEQEQGLVKDARQWLTDRVAELPGLQKYLNCWGDWSPWP